LSNANDYQSFVRSWGMATRESRFEVPTWVAGAIVAGLLLGLFYVFVYGGAISTLGAAVLGAVGLGMGAFTLYLLYRFVVAFEKIAEKY